MAFSNHWEAPYEYSYLRVSVAPRASSVSHMLVVIVLATPFVREFRTYLGACLLNTSHTNLIE